MLIAAVVAVVSVSCLVFSSFADADPEAEEKGLKYGLKLETISQNKNLNGNSSGRVTRLLI